MATHSSILAWRIPGTEEPSGLPSMGSHRVVHILRHVVPASLPVMPHRTSHASPWGCGCSGRHHLVSAPLSPIFRSVSHSHDPGLHPTHVTAWLAPTFIQHCAQSGPPQRGLPRPPTSTSKLSLPLTCSVSLYPQRPAGSTHSSTRGLRPPEQLESSKFGKLSSGHRTEKGQFSFQSQRKAMPKKPRGSPRVRPVCHGTFGV